MLGAPSFDALAAAYAGLSDQCAAIELELDGTVRVYQFGTSTQASEEFWLLWIPAGLETPTAYFAIQWSATSTPSPLAADLTPGVVKLPFGMFPAGVPYFMVRAPRGKPYGFYRWSGSDDEGVALRGVRMSPYKYSSAP